MYHWLNDKFSAAELSCLQCTISIWPSLCAVWGGPLLSWSWSWAEHWWISWIVCHCASWKISRCCVICPLAAQIQQKDDYSHYYYIPWWKTIYDELLMLFVEHWGPATYGIFMGDPVGRIAISPNPTFLQVLIISFHCPFYLCTIQYTPRFKTIFFKCSRANFYCKLNPNVHKIKKIENQAMFDFGGIRVRS